eukprot:TRINITY_DN77583_c0_g1_i1.p1 TRINITY_DN77583_c0_g1~~TRINITY_DN77583_c0_g1_i1.p1  ORF type:complete len:107 (-),score=12.44 TRINITY_DN77583_c0_g1_i1:242-532(-)
MKKTIFTTISIIFIFTGCFGGQDNSKQEWTSLIYPDNTNNKRSKKLGVYKTLEECRKASENELQRLDLTSRGFYQCGLNCSFNEGMQVEVCEKLSK